MAAKLAYNVSDQELRCKLKLTESETRTSKTRVGSHPTLRISQDMVADRVTSAGLTPEPRYNALVQTRLCTFRVATLPSAAPARRLSPLHA